MGVGPLLLYGLTAIAPLVIRDLDITRAQFGLFASVAYLAAALASRPAGRLVDRHSERRVSIVLYAGAAAALVLAAASWDYTVLLVAVVLCGLAQALSNPVTNRLVATHVGARQWGTVTGIKQSGVQMAQFFAGIVLPTVAVAVGWRGAIAYCMIVVAVGFAFSILHLPPEPTHEPERALQSADALPREVWGLATFAFLTGTALQATNVYLPLYGYEVLHLTVAHAGLISAVVGGVGLLGRIGWGALSGVARRPSVPMLLVAGVGAAGTLTIALSGWLHEDILLWVGAVLFGASGVAANVVVMLALIRVTPLHQLGRASGVLAVGLFAGFAVGPVSLGAAIDSLGSYDLVWPCVTAAYVVAAVVALGCRRS